MGENTEIKKNSNSTCTIHINVKVGDLKKEEKIRFQNLVSFLFAPILN